MALRPRRCGGFRQIGRGIKAASNAVGQRSRVDLALVELATDAPDEDLLSIDECLQQLASEHAECKVLALAAVVASSELAIAEGVDLSKVDRPIRRQPVWNSREPQFCLFIISAERRVWFVVDGDDLYMDINGNGDLTEPREKLPQRNLNQTSAHRQKVAK